MYKFYRTYTFVGVAYNVRILITVYSETNKNYVVAAFAKRVDKRLQF